METRLLLLVFVYKNACTRLVPSIEEGHDNRCAYRVIFQMETPSQVHAKKKKIATRVCRVKNIELGLSIIDKQGTKAFLQINCYSFFWLIWSNCCIFYKYLCVAYRMIAASENRLELFQIVRNQHTAYIRFSKIS